MSEIEQQTEAKYQQFLTEQIENDKTNASREKSDADMVDNLNTEVNNLRFKIRDLENNNKEKEYAELKTEHVKVKSDLDHAKQNLVNYIHSFTTLESQVKDRLHEPSLQVSDEVTRLRLENERLNEENSSLVNQKQIVEAELNDRLEATAKKLFIKNEEYETLRTRYTNLLETLNEERHEEIKSWENRQDLIKRTIEELRNQLEDTRNRRDTSLLMKDDEHRLLQDEA